jgi:hypothetical protein
MLKKLDLSVITPELWRMGRGRKNKAIKMKNRKGQAKKKARLKAKVAGSKKKAKA